jgi:hypothetical protein
VSAAVQEFGKKVDDLKERFRSGWSGPKFTIFDLAGQLQASTSAPTEAQMRTLEQLTAQVTGDIDALNRVVSADWPSIQEKLRAAKVGSPALKVVSPPKR